jgi:RNA polymerase sigma-70 factor (ECF subfamily)
MTTSLFNRLSRRQREEFKSQALVHVAALMRTALRLCDSRESAEDAVQETYLQAWKYWKTFQPGTSCRSWLFRILFNVIKKKHGVEAQRVTIEEAALNNLVTLRPNLHPGIHEVFEAFERLAEEHRAVLLLVAVEEMTYKEAASALGVPVGTVMSRLNRARARLRRLLGESERNSLTNAAGKRQ